MARVGSLSSPPVAITWQLPPLTSSSATEGELVTTTSPLFSRSIRAIS